MVVTHHERCMHRHGHAPNQKYRKHSAAGDMLTHAGMEALLASIPATIVMTVRDTVSTSVQHTLRSAIAKGEHTAGEAVSEAAGRFRVTTPVVIGAVIVGTALLHGLWRGKRKHDESRFQEAEERRRAEAQVAAHSRA